MSTYEQWVGNGASKEHRKPERIQHDLDEIMSEMSETLTAIQTKFSPGEMVDHLLHGLRGVGRGSSDFATNLGRTVRDNPVPAALIGAGLGFLLLGDRRRSGGGSSSGQAEEPGLGEKLASRAGGLIDEAKGDLSDRASELGHKAQEAGHRLSESGHRLAEGTRSGAHQVGEMVSRTWNDQPLVIGAICVAVGAALGASLPITRREERVLGPAADETKRRLEGAASEAVIEAGSKAGDTIEAQTNRASDVIATAHSEPQDLRSVTDKITDLP